LELFPALRFIFLAMKKAKKDTAAIGARIIKENVYKTQRSRHFKNLLMSLLC
jgi:hypothetical protein